jgi:hypothetical protein
MVIPAAAAIQATTRALVALAKPRTAALKDLGAMMRAARAARMVGAMLVSQGDAATEADAATPAVRGKHR